ncbi:MAG: N-acetylmuramoyl-L-alanine amidase [Frankiales bacterium]|jgi:N-acetylmuramoyl-L-alanine amidase|nr:N-acetylmuramoyl-L-alanine amidase [Frankiales bacterium]MDX6245767.1 N-acetylmuramoyl-L-alanine amidase [Frankiales bacterium]
MQPVRRGDRGPVVAEIRSKLASLGLIEHEAVAPAAGVPGLDGFDGFDEACDQAVRGFQQARGLSVDGIVGPETYRALDEAGRRLGDRVLSHRVSNPIVGDDVAELQHRLQELGFDCGRADGIFGTRTEYAVREFQRNVGLAPDGTCGPHTLKALARLRRTVVGGRAQWIRETEELHRAGPTLAGKNIVVDPGHGGVDRGARHHGLEEAWLTEDLAARIEGRLTALGAQAFLTRSADLPGGVIGDPERAALANGIGADLFLSLHIDASTNPLASGVSSYYFGSYGVAGRATGSAIGARLAALLQDEIATRTDLLDCRTHAKTWALLRLTRMPAVRLELGYLSNATDARRLASPEFRDALAEAVVNAVERLYLPYEVESSVDSFPVAVGLG